MKNLHLSKLQLILFLFLVLVINSCNESEYYTIPVAQVDDDTNNNDDTNNEDTDDEDTNDEDETPPPAVVTIDDSFNTSENTSIELELFTNDDNLPSEGFFSYTDPNDGLLSVNNNNTPTIYTDDIIIYTPNDGFVGSDTFTYTICDNLTPQRCDTATVTIIVEEVNEIDDEFSTELKAFPSAYGAGAYATGGRGGNVYHVTSLEDDGSEGTLRWALGQPRPSTIVFDVSGLIDLQDRLDFTGTDLTIAGQTAPVGGITITSNNINRVRGTNASNHIIRYLRIRPKNSGNDAFEYFGNNTGAYNIIMDHLSLSYGGDETLSLRGPETHNVTYQRVLIGESKTGSLFGDSSNPNSYDNSFLNSLFFNVSHRHPNTASDGRVDIINNVVHQWQYRLTLARYDVKLNHINNYYSMGLKNQIITNSGAIMLNQRDTRHNQAIYTAGNIIDKGFFEDPNADNKQLWVDFQAGGSDIYADVTKFVDTQYDLLGPPMEIKSANDAYFDVINNVGANASINADGSIEYYTDTQDTFYLDIMAQGEGAGHPYVMQNQERSWVEESMYINFFANINTTPINVRSNDFDTDRDGMPNVWEELYGTNPDVADNNEDKDGDGYTNLEEYLNSVDN